MERYSPAYKDLHAEVTKLDRYYIPTRYPDGLPEGGDPSASFDAEDARQAITTAEKAIAHARSFLNERSGDGASQASPP